MIQYIGFGSLAFIAFIIFCIVNGGRGKGGDNNNNSNNKGAGTTTTTAPKDGA